MSIACPPNPGKQTTPRATRASKFSHPVQGEGWGGGEVVLKACGIFRWLCLPLTLKY